MKILSIAMATLVFFILLNSSPVFAQFMTPNLVGLYMTSDGYGAIETSDVGTPVNVFLVLTKPENSEGSLYSGINGFECYLNFHPVGQMFLLAEEMAGGGTNLGDTDHISDGFLEYQVEFEFEVPVIEGAALLVSYTFMNLNPAPVMVYVGPTSSPSIPGEMSYVSNSPSREIMNPSSGYPDSPIFCFNGCPVPVTNSSFGAIKAVYR